MRRCGREVSWLHGVGKDLNYIVSSGCGPSCSTKWCLTNTGVRYIHGSTKFQLRPSLSQLQIVWYRSGKRSFPCRTCIFRLFCHLLSPIFVIFHALLRFMIAFLHHHRQYMRTSKLSTVYHVVSLVLGTISHNLM